MGLGAFFYGRGVVLGDFVGGGKEGEGGEGGDG